MCSNLSVFASTPHSINAENFNHCNSCSYECLKPNTECPQLKTEQVQIMDAICNSDLIYFVVPNYYGLPRANYFAFNERKVGYFNWDREKINYYMSIPKRFIVVSNTEGFDTYMQQQTKDQPKILYLKSRKYRKQSFVGDILDSEEARADLNDFLMADPI